MSQIRNRSSKALPVEADRPSSSRSPRRGRPPRRSHTYAAAPPPRVVAQRIVTPAPSCSRPMTSCAPPHVDQRLRGDPLVEDLLGTATARCSRTAAAASAAVEEGPGEQFALAVERARRGPGQALLRRSGPRRPTAQTSSTSRCWQIAFDPTASRSGRASSSSTGMPHRASSSAAVWPTGPLPMTATEAVVRGPNPCQFTLQLVPDLAVPLRGPDARPVDAVQLVPQALHVERQAVLEDRPAAVLRCQRVVGGLERLPAGCRRRAWTAPTLSAHHQQEVAGLLDRGVDRRPGPGARRPARRPAPPPRTPSPGPASWPTSRCGRRRRCRARPAPPPGRRRTGCRCRGSQATMSPAVWPRPQYCSTSSPRSPPRSIVSRSENVTSGQVSPGIDGGLLEQPGHPAVLAAPSPACRARRSACGCSRAR